ncbi:MULTISPECIES: HDOD domain-containing protein [Rubrivivax]|uniref:HDOD domain-containing protein n=2 Tax=Sphaerotilaceae TaxID=2975441 RepID=UPI00197E2240|nr:MULTISPECIES: HDOD domain-containing protein [Rubrivivax]MCD0417823.1 HDOD domain-containing protein [Rubrivivax sp. JA1024]
MSNPVPATEATPRAGAVRHFGSYQLLRLVGKSERTMAWRVADTRGGRELLLLLPRAQPADLAALERWTETVQRASRLQHPHLAVAVDIGVQDGWPYVAYDADDLATLGERVGPQGLPASECAGIFVQLLAGLAFAHQAGVAHQDLQGFAVLADDQGRVRLAGLEVAAPTGAAPTLAGQRDASQRDVLAAGLLLHHALAGQHALDEPDTGRVVERLPPLGREIVRLPWATAQLVPEPLRAIVNRATDRQERQRYRTARTLSRALEGWIETEAGGGGALALLSDRLRAAGVLPAQPGAAGRLNRLGAMERQRTDEIAEVALQDLALAFELLRAVNTAHVRGAQVSGSGPVLTVRRAIAMLGIDGVRRAATALRPWPGPLSEHAAADLLQLIAQVKRAGRIAAALRPAGYDAEVVTLLAMLQNLGRLVLQYHFPDEAQQIRRLMLPAPGAEREDPGMNEQAAAFAVLGIDVESLGLAVARHWGLDDTVLHMIRRLPLETPVRHADDDTELLRQVASAGNEIVDVLATAGAASGPALQRVALRYARALGLSAKELQDAVAASLRPAGAEPPPARPAATGGRA